MIDGAACDGMRLHQKKRLTLQLPERHHASAKALESLSADEHVVEERDGLPHDDALILGNGKIEESHIASVCLELLDGDGRDVGQELELDIGIELVIFDELIGKNVLEDGLGRADAQRSRRALPEFGKAAFHPVQKLQRARHIFKDEFAALLGELHPLVDPIEERGAELVFKLTYRLRHRGLRDIQLLRRFGEAPAPRDRIKDTIEFQIDHRFPSLPHTEFREDLRNDLLRRRLPAQEPKRLVGTLEVLGVQLGGQRHGNGTAGVKDAI